MFCFTALRPNSLVKVDDIQTSAYKSRRYKHAAVRHGIYTLVSAVTFALIQKLHLSISSSGINSVTVPVFVPPSPPLSSTMRLWAAATVVVFDGGLDVKGVQAMRAGASVAEGFPDAMNDVQKPIASRESLASLCVPRYRQSAQMIHANSTPTSLNALNEFAALGPPLQV
ncbi:hypothetical protein PTI98_013518 [Pleurotus ostreatus]|nr:hypothetical protein PTI98_013518 [Pleurotus ostreatus]